MDIRAVHPYASFWLDVADKAIKLIAVCIGALWTWWNYRKGRTYQQKLELDITGATYLSNVLYGDIQVSIKNIGATNHKVSHHGTFLTLSAVRSDLSEEHIRLFEVFAANDRIEPGESITDVCCWEITEHPETVRWVKLTLRIVSSELEWSSTKLLHVSWNSAVQEEAE